MKDLLEVLECVKCYHQQVRLLEWDWNIPEHKIELKVSNEIIEKRKQEMSIKVKTDVTGYLARYAKMVSSADKGAIINK